MLKPVGFIEETTDVKVEDPDLILENCGSVDRITAYIERTLAA